MKAAEKEAVIIVGQENVISDCQKYFGQWIVENGTEAGITVTIHRRIQGLTFIQKKWRIFGKLMSNTN